MANNLKKFQTDAEYSAATLNYPAVSWVVSGDTIHFDKTEPTPPTFQGKWLATYTGGTTASAECDSTSAISQNEITLEDIESVEIGNCVTSIGDSAFENGSFTSVTIPNSVTSIGFMAFYSCVNLTGITIPDSVTSIGTYALYSCQFSSVTIPDSVTYIGEAAFKYCGNLTSVTVNATTPPTLERGMDGTFDGTPIAEGEGYIYVPAASVTAYQSADGWSDYASVITAIQ